MDTPLQTPAAVLEDAPVLSTVQVARFSGCSLRQLDYWCRIGSLVPTQEANGSGSQRRYTVHEARTAWAILAAKRTQGGADGTGLHRVIGDALRLLPSDQWAGLLVTDSIRSVIVEHAADLLEALAALGPAVVIVDLDACPALEAEP